uniref:Tf2-1-like SH3-like domain-containing protein n=1 Tax=Asparagus officinalis TaxID=4686 RepID=Q2AA63_ASPOF|nr:hypothetical protein 18.t00012 [Asparagus officinalis]
MNFIVALPKSKKGNDSVWVIVDLLTKSAHFIPVKMTYMLETYARVFIQEIVRLHGVPETIVSDRGLVFTSHFGEASKKWKWMDISMDFIVGLPKSKKGNDSLWMIVDRLMKSVHFIPVRTTYTVETYARIFIREIVRLHGVSETIVSDRGSVFTSYFWKSFQDLFDSRLSYSSVFHPLPRQLEDHIPLIEFAYNNSYQAMIEPEDSLLLGLELVRQTTEKVGDFVMLKVSPMKGVQQFRRLGKLTPRYVGPFRIIERIGAVLYRLDLSASMLSVHDVFHVSMLKKHLRDEELQRIINIPKIEIQTDLSTIEVPVCILGREDKKIRNKVIPLVKVQWNRSRTEEASWEHEEDMCRDYPHLFE